MDGGEKKIEKKMVHFRRFDVSDFFVRFRPFSDVFDRFRAFSDELIMSRVNNEPS